MKTFSVIKQKGVVVNEVDILRQVRTWCSDAANGNYILSFEKAKKPRSNDQNRLMWVWFTCLARSWTEGYGQYWTPQNVHDYYCRLFLQATLPDGSTYTRGTSMLNTDEFTNFLNMVQADAATEHGIRLLSLTDIRYAEWAKQYQ